MTVLRPKIQILTEEYRHKILAEAKEILATQGIFMENQDGITLFEQEGINHKNQRYFIPPDIVDKALSTVPHAITLYD
ncbi:MAG: trimethylamine methyltransferase family protein, partial [Promethearchaeota archaeon]